VREMVHQHLLDTTVVRIFADQAVPHEYPSGVCVADEDGFPAGIQKDAVGRLLSDALHTEEFIPKVGSSSADMIPMFPPYSARKNGRKT